MGEILYFIDGYHGGIEGHMPAGSWEDILEALDEYKDWKLSLEIEPESFDYLKVHDNDVYERIKRFVSDTETCGRIEFISGSFAQPFCWAIHGESNVRQLLRGISVIKEHFKTVEIDTYAVQEPCFTSSLPQILKKLGFKRMSLKNPTAWGGYMDKMKGSMVRLYSADGSYLPAVPRYECEELVSCSATEGAGYEYTAIKGFAEKCVKNKILHPVGMCLQDLGWKARPLIRNIHVEYVTWREYFDRFIEDLDGDIIFSQEAVLCQLPWGNLTLQKMCRKVQTLESRMLKIEKLMAIAEISSSADASQYDSGDDKIILIEDIRKKLNTAFDKLLLSQHHDGFICASTTGSNFDTWDFRSDYLTAAGHKLLDEVEAGIFLLMQVDEVSGLGNTNRYVRVYNTIGAERTDACEVITTLPKGSVSFTVYDEYGRECLSQWQVIREHSDKSIAAAKLMFEACVNGIGYSTYLIKGMKTHKKLSSLAEITVQNTVEVETSLLLVVFDLAKGGAIVRLYDKELNKDFAEDEPIGVLKGYSIKEDRFISNSSSKAKCEILKNGSLATEIKITGEFHGIYYEIIAEIREGNKKIDMTSSVFFKEKTDIGYPLSPEKGNEYHGTKRSSCREDYKLAFRFMLPMKDFIITKHAPYDNYKSNVYDTRYDGWDNIKNNMLHQYIDFYNPEGDYGIGFLCDHVTGYSLIDNQFSITQAFGYHAGFWWGYQPLIGKSQIAYSIVLHKGDYEEGGLPLYSQRKNEPLTVQVLSSKPEKMNREIFCFEDAALEVVTILKEKDKFILRVFNNSQKDKSVKYTQEIPGLIGQKTDLCGNILDEDNKTAKPSEIISFI